MSKKVKTELPITILTDYKHDEGDSLDLARTRIEKAAFYLESLFNLFSYAAEANGESGKDIHEDRQVFWDILHTCEIGRAIVDSLYKSMMAFNKAEREKGEDDFDYSTLDDASVSTLAPAVSDILNNPNLPIKIHNALMRALDDVYNETDTNVLAKFETSPEFLEAVFSAYAERKSEEEAEDDSES